MKSIVSGGAGREVTGPQRRVVPVLLERYRLPASERPSWRVGVGHEDFLDPGHGIAEDVSFEGQDSAVRTRYRRR